MNVTMLLAETVLLDRFINEDHRAVCLIMNPLATALAEAANSQLVTPQMREKEINHKTLLQKLHPTHY